MDDLRIVFNEDGTVSGVFKDEHREIFEALGIGMVNRASHVEPDDQGNWWVDLSPVGGPKNIGPFTERQDALNFEVKELEKYGY